MVCRAGPTRALGMPVSNSKRAAPLLSVSKNGLHQIANSDLHLEIERRGKGPPLLLLYGEDALELDAPFLADLAQHYEVIIPSPPGFGRSDTAGLGHHPDDIAYAYLDLIDELGLGRPGGWLLIGRLDRRRNGDQKRRFISALVLVDPYGIKIGEPTERDIADVWLLHPDEVAALKWHDVAKGKRDFPSMSEDKLTVVARNWNRSPDSAGTPTCTIRGSNTVCIGSRCRRC